MASSNLTLLLSLRRDAEESAKRALAEAVTALTRAEQEKASLEALVAQATRRLEQERRGCPANAAEGLARERFRQLLRARREQAVTKAKQHREGPLARAHQAERAALEALRQARLERQAAERLWERRQAEQRKQAERRDEQRDEDWMQASHHRKRPT